VRDRSWINFKLIFRVRVPFEIVQARRAQLSQLLQQNRYLDVHELCHRLKISEATARRDLSALEKDKLITRTHGGALVDFNLRFPSFQQRQHQEVAGKRQIAEKAAAFVRPGMTIYLDAGTTIFAFARLLVERKVIPLTVVTASIPVADMLAGDDGVKVILAGGEFLRRQSVLVGKTTQKILSEFNFDLAYMSAEGANGEGLWNSQADVVKAQKIVLKRTKQAFACVDATKLGQTAPQFLAKWSTKLQLLSDATPEKIKTLMMK
jgi:DeoR/GlpR family transcriptional regulator of sugar metabolism